MNMKLNHMQPQSVRARLAMLAGAMLVTGALWQSPATGAAALEAAQTPNQRPAAAAIVASGRDSYADLVNLAAPAVVTIRTEGRARVAPTQFFFDGDDDSLRRFVGDRFERGGPRRMPRQRGLGSGVIVSRDGYILTNHHVVDNAEDISVDLQDKRTLKAKLVGSDKPSDLALLKVEATDLKALPLGNSDDVRVGDVVLALGNPLGIGQTVTMGIISAKGRSTGVGDGSYEDFLQTDAPINHGNSGGALVNTKGELVGINSQIVSVSEGNIGIGFAIPANMARRVMDQLRTDGRVRRAQLGVVVQPLTSDLAESLGLKQVGGALVNRVESGSAADRAGLKRGDVITRFSGSAVQDYNSLRNRVAETAPGSAARVTVIREGQERELSVTLDETRGSKRARGNATGDRDDHADSSDQPVLGVSVQPLTPELAARAGIDRRTKGLLVDDVDPDGRAAAAGIRSNDVIQEVNRQSVETVDQLRAALRNASGRPLLLLISREGRELFITVRTPQ
jgi:Do/DeqQ family serine protease